MALTPVNYKNSNTTLGFAGTDLANILLRREYFSMGGLYSWGTNLDFGLGDPGAGTTAASRSSPQTVGRLGVTSWEWVAIKARTAAAVRSDGTLWTWGRATYGVLGDGTTTSRSSPGTTSVGGTTWDEVATSTSHMLAVKNDGTLWTWGRNSSGQLGTNTTTSRSTPAQTAIANTGGDSWKIVAAGGDSSACIKNDGTLWTWGLNSSGQLGTGNTTARSTPAQVAGGGTTWEKIAISNIITAGSAFSAGIKTDGTLWTWGGNLRGQLGDGSTSPRSSPQTVAGGGTNWKDVAVGDEHVVAVKYNGTLWTWGTNTNGELGASLSGSSSRSSPDTVAGGGTTWRNVSASTNISAAIKTDGILWTWGTNTAGQLGDGTSTNKTSPVKTTGDLINWKMVAVGGASTGGASVGIVENESYFPDIVVYTAPGTFSHSIVEGKQGAFAEVWGGGGGGGDGYTSPALAGGTGGSGGYARSYLDVTFKVNKTMNVVVGTGGTSPGGGTPGSDGTNSSLTGNTYSMTTITGGFGTGGTAADPGTISPGNPGTTGSGTGGTDYNSSGALSRTGRNSLVYGTGGAGGPGAGPGATFTPGTPGSNGAVIITYV